MSRRIRDAAKSPETVFLNVPFDSRYEKLFRALVFAIHDCGFIARCALETDDGSEIRLEKLYRIIGECRYGIHDLSRTKLDTKNRLPRFNMPLELGIFLGAKKYGNHSQRLKSCLILEREVYQYQKYCSDIAGQDIRAHNGRVEVAVRAVRDWLQTHVVSGASIPSGKIIADRYLLFAQELAAMCKKRKLLVSELSFVDYRTMVRGWLDENPS